MESAFSTLGFVIFGLSISIYAIVVESNRGKVGLELPSVTLLASPSPARRHPVPQPRSAPRPKSPKKDSASSPSSIGQKNGGWKRSPHPSLPPPQPPLRPPRPPLRPPQPSPPPSQSRPSSPSPKWQSRQMNKGKVLGLFFLGMAAFMQIVVVGFLVFKRRQLLKTRDIYGTGS